MHEKLQHEKIRKKIPLERRESFFFFLCNRKKKVVKVWWMSVKPIHHIFTSNHHHSLANIKNSLSTNFHLSKQTIDSKKNFRKFSPETAAKLPHPPMAFFVHKKNFFAKVRQNQVNFSISSFFLSAQHVRDGPQHAQALTLGLNKKDQVVLKLCQKIEVLRQLPARDLGTQRALHEHSRTASHKQTFSLSAFSLSGLVHITYNPCVFVSSIHSKNSLRKLHHKKSQKKPLAIAIASHTLKKFAQKQLFTHHTNQHKTTCQGLASSYTGPHRILSCPNKEMAETKTFENSHQKLLQNSLIRLWNFLCTKKTFSPKLDKNKSTFPFLRFFCPLNMSGPALNMPRP
jgi:hypothetical protein